MAEIRPMSPRRCRPFSGSELRDSDASVPTILINAIALIRRPSSRHLMQCGGVEIN